MYFLTTYIMYFPHVYMYTGIGYSTIYIGVLLYYVVCYFCIIFLWWERVMYDVCMNACCIMYNEIYITNK